MRLHEVQAQFRLALFDPAAKPFPDGLNFRDEAQAKRRFSIYRNTVFASLTNVLGAAFPVCALLIGPARWQRLAEGFIAAHPPQQAHLLAWGGALADYLAKHPLLEVVPYLADMAHLEWARVQAYHAADATPLDLAALQSLPPETLPDLCLSAPAGGALVVSAWPVASMWAAHDIEAGTASPLPAGMGPETVLIVRPHTQVDMVSLDRGETILLQALWAGQSFGQAALAALEAQPDFALQTALVRLLLAGAFASWSLATEESTAQCG